ncbi:restriction endonuclease subunit S [Algoriphagus marincola]|uniref:restriction endonuclease subunit S n=1 Tax=Algoriphagus marincola TaxID=264027 RepID=UPI000403E971|nr:restriction endonuclease subunit S [Algoriphagus marincola]
MNKKLEPELRFPEFKNKGSWEIKRLIEIASSVTDKNRKNVHSRVLTNSAEYGVVDQQDFFDKQIANSANLNGYYIVKKGDFVYNPRVSKHAPVGPISKNKIGDGLMSPLYSIFRFSSSETEFFEFFFKTTIWHKYLLDKAKQGARHDRMGISSSDLKNLPLPYPSPAEQQKIADCLSSLDELIKAETERLEALQAHKKGLMQQLFPAEGETVPKLRFPEFQDSGEWVEKKLGDPEVSSFVNQKVKVDELEDDSYVSTENLLSDFGGKVKISKLPNSGSFNCFLPGDILLSNIRPYLKKVWLSNQKGAASNDIIIIRNNRNLDSLFFSFLLKSDRFINHIMKSAEGVKMPRGNKDSIKEFKIVVPKRDEQLKIAELLTAIDIEISSQSEKIQTLKSHKKGLLQQLFPQLD